MFVLQGLTLTGIGVVCGLSVAFGTMRLMSSLLYHVSPVDPWTYATASDLNVCFAGTDAYRYWSGLWLVSSFRYHASDEFAPVSRESGGSVDLCDRYRSECLFCRD